MLELTREILIFTMSGIIAVAQEYYGCGQNFNSECACVDHTVLEARVAEISIMSMSSSHAVSGLLDIMAMALYCEFTSAVDHLIH